jgi:arylsulfatase A-like enzyme
VTRATSRARPATAALAALAAAACGGSGPPPPEHVLLVLVDTLRADHLGSLGHPRGPTPAIDSVAARGVLFEEAYAQSSWTSPSIVSLFTGRRLAEDRLDLPAALPTLAESFQRAGWATGGFIMNDMVNAEQGFARGFDHFEQLVPYSENGPILAWLAAHAGGRAFTYVHLNEVHDPYLPPPEHLKARLAPDPLPEERLRYYRGLQSELGLEGGLTAEVRAIEEELGGYVDEVAYADARIGGLLAGLAEHGLERRTCVVITADHGEGLWTRVAMMAGRRGKALASGEAPRLTNTLMPTHGNQVYRELLHVPWVMSSPGLPAGVRVRGPVELVDLFPTLLELCDLPAPAGLAGRSRLASIRGSAQPPAEAFAQTRFCSTLITPDGWQVIVPTELGRREEGLEVELYHLPSDPEARENRAAEEGERLAQLIGRVQELRQAAVWSGAPSEAVFGREVLDAIRRLGYLESGVVDLGPEQELLELEIAELVRRATSAEEGEEARRSASRAVRVRAGELDEPLKERLRARLGLEACAAVRAELERALERAP